MFYLRERKFKHSFQNVLNPVCSCGFDVESASPYVLRCTLYNDERHTLLCTLKHFDCRLLDVTETILIKVLLFGKRSLDAHTNTQVPTATFEYNLTAKKFDECLFHS